MTPTETGKASGQDARLGDAEQSALPQKGALQEFNQLPPEERENVKQKWQEYRQQKDDEQRRKVEPAGSWTLVPGKPAQEAK